jgi:hypothetical protein
MNSRKPPTVRRLKHTVLAGYLVAVFVVSFQHLIGTPLQAERLAVEFRNSPRVIFVGAVQRWDRDGSASRRVDPRAKIEAPQVDAEAERRPDGKWVFDLPPGTYDLIVLAEGRIRLEGFYYPPVLEFDPFFGHQHSPPDKVRDFIRGDIAQSRHYENKVVPLFFGGNEDRVRVLVQLLRDEPTSYDAAYGEQVATLRHEIWQYTARYGAWTKEKRTRVLDRVLMAKRLLRKWTWVWVPALGKIEIQQQPVDVCFVWPSHYDGPNAQGLTPY